MSRRFDGASATGPGPEGSWRLGSEPEGRIRARLEAPLDASLVVRCGDQLVSIPVAAVLERPQHTPPQAPLIVNVERLAWDSLAVDLGESGWRRDRRAGDRGARLDRVQHPLAGLRGSQRSRDGRSSPDSGWRCGLALGTELACVPTNRREPAAQSWSLIAPRAEGTYVLEVRATWEPSGARDGSRLGRLIRRRKPAAVTDLGHPPRGLDGHRSPGPIGRGGRAGDGHGRETEVDAIDLARLRSYRLLAVGPIADGGARPALPGRFPRSL